MNNAPTYRDILILSIFVVLITLQPYYLHGDIIMMETGIHLPAINALFHGGVPYRDFFFLRGPLELYVPAFLMLLFGKNLAVLPTFYYVGTLVTLLILVVLAKQIYRTRFILYLMVPVVVARTFPRISFNYWGGMRYAIGLLSILLLITFLKKQRLKWIFGTGIISGVALLTAVDVGLCSVMTVGFVLVLSFIVQVQDRRFVFQSSVFYILGILSIALPCLVYFLMTQSLIPFGETLYTVVTNLYATFPTSDTLRFKSFSEFVLALWPGSKYFKFITPLYLYLCLPFYIIARVKTKTFDRNILCVLGVAAYGVFLYICATGRIEGNHVEMALQPEKIVLFFIVEEIYLQFRRLYQEHSNNLKRFLLLNSFVVLFVASSVGYCVARYNHRFIVVKLIKNYVTHKNEDLSHLAGQAVKALNIERAHGLVLPRSQAEEITEVVNFIRANTKPEEAVFTFAELGTYNFLFDRPFVGRFPVATFSWISEQWHSGLMADLKRARPRFVVMTKVGDRSFPAEWYFRNKRNIERFNETVGYIRQNYVLQESVGSVEIYKRKS